jgi:hypothetical protein
MAAFNSLQYQGSRQLDETATITATRFLFDYIGLKECGLDLDPSNCSIKYKARYNGA